MKQTLLAGVIALCLTACAYESWTDYEEKVPDDGSYYAITDLAQSGYDEWIYINLETGEYESHPDATLWYYAGDGSITTVNEEEEITIDWHIAAHRYQFRTNNGSVLLTDESDITAITELPDGDYTADEQTNFLEEYAKYSAGEDGVYCIADMSGMMTGNMGYIWEPIINRTLCKAITTEGSMSSKVYYHEENVFVIKWDNGEWAKFQLTGLTSSRGTSGYLNFNYKYVNN